MNDEIKSYIDGVIASSLESYFQAHDEFVKKLFTMFLELESKIDKLLVEKE